MAKTVNHKERKREIRAIALGLFARHGFEAVNFGMIAKECGIARTLLYTYFKDKRQIFNEAIDEGTEVVAVRYREVKRSHLPADAKLRQICISVMAMLYDNRDFLCVIVDFLCGYRRGGKIPVNNIMRHTMGLKRIIHSFIVEAIELKKRLPGPCRGGTIGTMQVVSGFSEIFRRFRIISAALACASSLFAENPLPAEYVAAPFIESDGTQYVDTGICPDWTTSVAIDCALFNVSSTEKPRLFGTDMNGGGTIGFAVYVNGSGNWASSARDGAGDYTATTVKADAERHLHELDAATGVYARDGVTRTTSRSGTCVNSSSLSMYVFGSHRTAGLGSAAKMRLYGMRIEQGGELVRDLRPCVETDSDGRGRAGLYDAANDVFHPASGGELAMLADAVVPGVVAQVSSDAAELADEPGFAPLTGLAVLAPGTETVLRAPRGKSVSKADGEAYKVDGWRLTVRRNGLPDAVSQGRGTVCALMPVLGDELELVWRWKRVRPGTMFQIR